MRIRSSDSISPNNLANYFGHTLSLNFNYVLSAFAGLFLGLALFTKVPALTAAPLVASVVYFNSGKNIKYVAVCLLVAIGILQFGHYTR